MNKDELKKILDGDGGAYLRGADLQGADLRGTSLRGVDLRNADLRGADLRGSNLENADLENADLQGANLKSINLRGADLRSADLRGADLRNSHLKDADLKNADLRGAKLELAYTHGMKTDAATRIDWPMVCPETGAFVAWKQARLYSFVSHSCGLPCLVQLEIPADAERSSATTNKCRASKAMVLEILNMDGTRADVTKACSSWGRVYKVGKMVYPDKWDYNRWNECSHGIHFFMTRCEAVAW